MISGEKLWAFRGYLEDLNKLNTGILTEETQEAIHRAIGWYADTEFQNWFTDHFGEKREEFEAMKSDDPKRDEASTYLKKLNQFHQVMKHVRKMHTSARETVIAEVNQKKREIRNGIKSL